MYVQKRNYGAFIQSVKINVGLECNMDKEDDALITLRELPTLEMMNLREAYDKGQKELIMYFREILPTIIIDHNFYEDENKKMTGENLTNLIFEKMELSSKVIGEYSQASFFTQQKKREDK